LVKGVIVKQAGCVVLLKLRVVKSAVVKVQDVKQLWRLKFSRLEYKMSILNVWAGYIAKLNHLVLSVFDGVEMNVPAFRVDGTIARFVWPSAAECLPVCIRGLVPARIVR
jgi:hypothetical protein